MAYKIHTNGNICQVLAQSEAHTTTLSNSPLMDHIFCLWYFCAHNTENWKTRNLLGVHPKVHTVTKID